jgi:hypothetical protein
MKYLSFLCVLFAGISFSTPMSLGTYNLNDLDNCNRRHNTYQIETLAEKPGGWDCHFDSGGKDAGAIDISRA